jgi:hypothetical protein
MSRVSDTSPDVERIVRDKVMARSGEERLIMASQMFDSAREMIKASLPEGLSEKEQRRALFERIYGNEINLEN